MEQTSRQLIYGQKFVESSFLCAVFSQNLSTKSVIACFVECIFILHKYDFTSLELRCPKPIQHDNVTQTHGLPCFEWKNSTSGPDLTDKVKTERISFIGLMQEI